MRAEISVQKNKILRNQKQFLISQIITSIFNNIISGVLMTGLLLYIGIAPSRVGVFLSIPMLANVFQMLLERMWNHFAHYKQTMNRIILLARFGILSIIFIPLIFKHEAGFIKTRATGIILFISYMLASNAGIHFNYWMVNSIDPEKQGDFFTFRDRVVVGGTLFISFAAAWMEDQLKAVGLEYYGFLTAFSIAAVLAIIDYSIIRTIDHKRDIECTREINRDSLISVVWMNRKFFKFLLYLLWLNISINLANPYYNSYMLDCLKLKYTHIMCLTALQVCVQILASFIWKKIANQVKWSRILNWTVLILGIQFFCWAAVTRETLILIVIIFVTSGLISTGLITGQFMVPYEFIDKSRAMACLSVCTSVAAIGGFTGSLIGSVIISVLNKYTWRLGKLTINSMQINMIISGVALLLTVLYANLLLGKKTV